MAEETKTDKVTLEELVVSTLATTDALAKPLIAKGIITDDHHWLTRRSTFNKPMDRATG
jgi:hypothetical protein